MLVSVVSAIACDAEPSASTEGTEPDDPPKWLAPQLRAAAKARDSSRAAPNPTAEPIAEAPVAAPSSPASPSSPTTVPADPAPDSAQRDGRTTFTVGTFDLSWAMNAQPHEKMQWRAAATPEDWTWKLDGIVFVLADADLDLIALQETGGLRETDAIAQALNKDPALRERRRYRAIHKTTDFAQQVALLYDENVWCPVPKDQTVETEARSTINLYKKQVMIELGLRGEGPCSTEGKEWPRVQVSSFQIAQISETIREAQAGQFEDYLSAPFPQRAKGTKGDEGRIIRILAASTFDEGTAASIEPSTGCQRTEALETERRDDGTTHNADAIYVCGTDLVEGSTETPWRTKIWNQTADPSSKPWSSIPVDRPPHRDLSDHLLLKTRVRVRPKAKSSSTTQVNGRGSSR